MYISIFLLDEEFCVDSSILQRWVVEHVAGVPRNLQPVSSTTDCGIRPVGDV